MRKAKKDEKKLGAWDNANLLQNMKNEMVHVTTVARQRYVYREWERSTRTVITLTALAGMIAHSELKKF
jgi:hypothetical protein